MFGFLRGFFEGVARGLSWVARQALGLACDVIQAPFVALWRYWNPPQPETEESTADVLRQVAGMIQGQSGAADKQAVAERPAPRQASEATIRKSMERALAYTDALIRGETLPSLAHVQPALCHALRRLTRNDAEAMHRELMGALGMDAENWVRPGREREVMAPGPEETPTLRYA